MGTPSYSPRGTTHLKLPLDIVRPSEALAGPPSARYSHVRWLRPLLIVAATTAALAFLIGAAALL